MKRVKIVYVGFAFEHHKGTHGGYDHIKDYLPYDYVIDCQRWFENSTRPNKNIFDRIKRKVFLILFDSKCFPMYIFKCMYLLLVNRYLTIHFIYTESLLLPLVRLFPKRITLVCTVHQPLSWFDTKRLNRLKMANKIILVGDKEIDKFQNIFGKEKITFIPHGIDTTFYKPDSNCKLKTIHILTVGNWMRDYKLANEVYRNLLAIYKNIEINVVSKEIAKSDFLEDDRLHVFCGISDEQLRSLYQQTDCLFLPLLRYTANNALLEAASCGCKILIASNYNDNSYIPQEYIYTCALEKNVCVERIKEIISYKKPKLDLRDYIVNHYDWHIISNETYEMLQKCAIKYYHNCSL